LPRPSQPPPESPDLKITTGRVVKGLTEGVSIAAAADLTEANLPEMIGTKVSPGTAAPAELRPVLVQHAVSIFEAALSFTVRARATSRESHAGSTDLDDEFELDRRVER
jgi:hypothetical protein